MRIMINGKGRSDRVTQRIPWDGSDSRRGVRHVRWRYSGRIARGLRKRYRRSRSRGGVRDTSRIIRRGGIKARSCKRMGTRIT